MCALVFTICNNVVLIFELYIITGSYAGADWSCGLILVLSAVSSGLRGVEFFRMVTVWSPAHNEHLMEDGG